MLPKALLDRLNAHPTTGWFFNPLSDLRWLRAKPGSEIETWVGERPDGALELVRSANQEASLELLLNEADVARQLESEAGVASLAWSAKTGAEKLTLGFRWRAPFELSYPLDLRWLLRSFITLAKTVGALHRANLIHADLKPEVVHWAEDPSDLLLWDLRMAQPPGAPRFEAFSARTAAPEQVSGGDLDPSADVYALGVMLYSLFIRDRFPAIILPKGGGGPASAAGPRQAALSAITAMGAFEGDDEPDVQTFELEDEFPIQQQMMMNVPRKMALPPAPRPSGTVAGPQRDHQAILGAKILFAVELERVVNRTADIGVAKELLAVIETATAQKRAERYPDANAFATELARLLALAEELAGA